MQLFDIVRLPLVAALLGSQLVAAGGFQNSCRSCGIALCQGKSLSDYGNCASLSCECQRTDGSWAWSTLGFNGIIQNTCGQLTRGGGMTATCHNEELLQGNTLLHAQCKDCSGRDAWSIINIGEHIELIYTA
ncbi:hypothetical protein GQ53DRAFT_831852 [Thozetella sp. PMI_491]|nr:hypothetical protein GQ53DRAFT_831852 [Thozetella sp. PMI_491]